MALESKPVLAEEVIGVRPRSILKKERKYPATVDFSDFCSDNWTVSCFNGSSGDVYRTREELLWGEAVTAITYKGESEDSEVVISPEEPVSVPECDSIQLWLKGEIIGWAPKSKDNPRITPFVLLVDGNQKKHRIEMNQVNCPWWYVMYKKFDTESLPKPIKFVGLGITGCINEKQKKIYLDSLYFFKLKEAPVLDLPGEYDDGFVVSEETILPSRPAVKFSNAVERENGKINFKYEGADETFEWQVVPESGPLAGITASVDGKKCVKPCSNSRFDLESNERLRLLSCDLVEKTLVAKYGTETQTQILTVSYEATGKSLIVKMEGGNEVCRIHSGVIRGQNAKAFYVPYLTVTPIATGPKLAYAAERFFSILPCWYTSNSSTLLQSPVNSIADDQVLIGDTVYEPKLNGQRNKVKEKFVLTASSNFDEVFPTIPHKPSEKRTQIVELVNLYEAYNPIQNWRNTLESFKHIRRQGVSKLFVYHHSQTWADDDQGPQEWTMTADCAPCIGNAAMNSYLGQLRSLGYLPCFYTNYCDMQPVSMEFDYDKVVRTKTGEISTHTWPGSYPVKPVLAPVIENKYAPMIRRNFGVRASFLDVHTAITPWDRVDYDSRGSDAASYKQGYLASCQTILNDKRVYDGPVVGEGATRLFFAGLTDGDNAELAECFNRPHERPWLVDFDLKCLHDLHTGIGMSSMPRFLPPEELKNEDDPHGVGINHYLAATIAFGHAGMLPLGVPQPCDYHSLVRIYYLTQQLQQRYLLDRAVDVKYFDGKQLTTTETAIAQGHVSRNQIYVEYANGLTLAVNGNKDVNWKIDVAGKTYVLPPYGWVALKDEFVEYSALINGNRSDWVYSDEYVFFDSWGQMNRYGIVASDGAGSIYMENEELRLVPFGSYTEMSVSADFINTKLGNEFKLLVENISGNRREISHVVENGMVILPDENNGDFAFIFAKK